MVSLSLPIGNNYGWGVCGRHVAQEISKKEPTQLFATVAKDNDPLRSLIPEGWNPNYPVAVDDEVMLHAIQGPNLLPANLNVWSKSQNVGYCFIEDIEMAYRHVANASRYFDGIITGSKWCTDSLRGLGLMVRTAIQGVDTDIFNLNCCSRDTDDDGNCPIHESRGILRNPIASGPFYIFSGGKFEYRKGQDIVIAAFKALMDKYPDMHLLCSWGNLWPQTMNTMRRSTLIKYPETETNDWHMRIRQVMQANGIPVGRYTSLPLMDHSDMADYYRACQVGLFPNRCEAGTNLPMMEAMACGLPVIGSMATGHLEVLDVLHCWPIDCGKFEESGWFEPNLDLVIWLLEEAHQKRATNEDLGRRGAKFIKQFTWGKTAEKILQVCM